MTKPFLGKVVVTLLVNLSSGCQDIRETSVIIVDVDWKSYK